MTEESCPKCSKEGLPSFLSHIEWLLCDGCERWFHSWCLNIEQPDEYETYFCEDCKDKGESKLKSGRRKRSLNYAALDGGNTALVDFNDTQKWVKILSTRKFEEAKFDYVNGSDVTLEWYSKRVEKGNEPFVIEKMNGLDMEIPSNLTVYEVAKLMGRETPIEVIDVATQTEVPNWNLGKWSDYFMSKRKDRIRNVISLEISGTKLGNLIRRPRIVRELDWVDKFWPNPRKNYPKVQLYCLMSVAESYTDWHIDFGGTSVFYHIISGLKDFYFVKPTTTNLKRYANWSGSGDQSMRFFGDEVDHVLKISLKSGQTMIIPTGWIHAVYTPMDSLVIGGNFLHGMNASLQFTIYDIEDKTNVPQKFRFPYFETLLWYALKGYENMESEYETERKSIQDLYKYLYKRYKRGGQNGKSFIPKEINAEKLLEEMRRKIKIGDTRNDTRNDTRKEKDRENREIQESPRKKTKVEILKEMSKENSGIKESRGIKEDNGILEMNMKSE